MDQFAMLTTHEQLVETVLYKVPVFRIVLSRIYGTLSGLLEIPDVPR